MAINVSFNGATIYKPGSYSKFNIDRGGAYPLGPTGVIGIFGEADRGTPGDEEIDFSPTEFRLLQELMRNKGRVLTKSNLLRDVWEIDFETETSVLDTYISYLRKKLNRDDHEFIRTVRGVGYQIVEPS